MTDKAVEVLAEQIATTVAMRCQGDRKPNQAPQRYAIIWQAARLGAIEALTQAKRPAAQEIEI